MKGKKQSRLESVEKRLAAVTRVLQELINEIQNTKTIALGVHQTIKEMPNYEKAIKKLKKKVAEEPDKTKTVNSSGKAGQ
jgi:pyruvate/2-oxoacid:ferredoxin oxidoreductase beta subunit